MSNLTITIDDDILRRARLRALEQGTSVNAVLRDFLKAYSGIRGEQEKAINDIISISKAHKSRHGQQQWTREDLHERLR